MGIPQWVQSVHHHNPDDILALAERHRNVNLLITHTFIDADGSPFEPVVTNTLPKHPTNVHHVEDGATWIFQNSEWIQSKN